MLVTNKKNVIMKKKYFVVEEDTGLYNIFSVEDFDADGYLWEHNGEDGYHMDDFKEQICDLMEELEGD